MESTLDELVCRFDTMPEADRVAVIEDTIAATSGMKWIPNPGPQTEAYFCQADVLLYGGQAAGGKTDLLGGLALMKHKRSLIMRRQYTDLGALIERVREVDGSWAGFNGSPPPRLRTADGRLIDFGAAAQLGDERHWQGQPHDLLGMDEVVHFLEAQVRFLMGWVRPTGDNQDQRCRTVLATNPPDSAEGDYIIGMFRPWLDMTHHNPAKPGELRHYVTDPDGKDFEVDGP
ncbi:MAG: terminase, partial [Proteobacteria bacterium]|nr:terminase [Pseudomonadota bacterium]